MPVVERIGKLTSLWIVQPPESGYVGDIGLPRKQLRRRHGGYDDHDRLDRL